PGNQPSLDGTLEPCDFFGTLGLQMIPDQPSASGPNEFGIGWVLGVEVFTGRNRLRDELLMILLAHTLGVVGKANIEMGLKDQMDQLVGRLRHENTQLSPPCHARRDGCLVFLLSAARPANSAAAKSGEQD